MPMNKPKKTSPELSLSVQYGVAEPRLPRWRLRRWAQRALDAALEEHGEAPCRLQLGLRLVGLAEGRKLNASYRGKDYATNVLTFEYDTLPDGAAAADLVICVPVLAREAREQHKAFLSHAAHLVVHGTLHALGYDHVKLRDARRMESLETRILAAIDINDPYASQDTLLQADRLS